MTWKDLRDLDKEDVLNALGLESRRTTADVVLPALGLFGAGVLVGAGLGLLFAPKPGRDLRADVTRRVRRHDSEETPQVNA